MLSSQHFSQLLLDVQQAVSLPSRTDASFMRQGELILDAFLRHTSFEDGAIYLLHPREPGIVLAAKSARTNAPRSLESGLPLELVWRENGGSIHHPIAHLIQPEPHALLPLRDAQDEFGMIALSDPNSAGVDLELLRAASNYLAVILTQQRMVSVMKEGDFQLKYRLWELESLYDIGLSITSTLDLEKLTGEILLRTLSLLNARRAALYLKEGDRFALAQSFGDVRAQFFDEELDAELSRKLVEEGQPIKFDENANCIFPGCHSFVALPITVNGETTGVLAAADREVREGGLGAFDDHDLQLLSRFANQAAIALENAKLHKDALAKQLMERDLELAVTIQNNILPRGLPAVDGFDLAAFSRPARQVGGDYHAFFEHDGVLSICLADVSGKGFPAALLVSAFHAAIQLLFDEGRDLGEIASELNRHIHRWSSENKFITLVIATLDRQSGVIRFVNAGHNPAYLVIGDRLEMLKSHGLPIGMLSQTRYTAQARPLPAGALLVVYSDGITEAENIADDEYENDRLEEVLRTCSARPASEVRDAIIASVDAFVGAAPQKDDQTLVIVRA